MGITNNQEKKYRTEIDKYVRKFVEHNVKNNDISIEGLKFSQISDLDWVFINNYNTHKSIYNSFVTFFYSDYPINLFMDEAKTAIFSNQKIFLAVFEQTKNEANNSISMDSFYKEHYAPILGLSTEQQDVDAFMSQIKFDSLSKFIAQLINNSTPKTEQNIIVDVKPEIASVEVNHQAEATSFSINISGIFGEIYQYDKCSVMSENPCQAIKFIDGDYYCCQLY